MWNDEDDNDVVMKQGQSSTDKATMTILQNRLTKIQTALQRATHEAYQGTATTVSPRGVEGHNDNDGNDNANASFHLGMDLFGPDPSTMERRIRDKLDDLENELQRVFALSEDSHRNVGDDDDVNNNNNHQAQAEREQKEEDEDDNNASIRSSESMIRSIIEDSQHHVSFLKQASIVRSLLEDAATIGSPALSTEPDLGQASRYLIEAHEAIQTLENILSSSPSSSFAIMKTTTLDQPAQQRQQQKDILNSLKQSLRRQRLELLHKANTVVDSSLQMEAGQLIVKSSTHLEHAFDVLETLQVDSAGTGGGGGTFTPTLSLDDILRRFTRRLYDRILTPILDPIRNRSNPTGTGGSTALKGNDPSSSLAPTQIHQHHDEPTRRIIGVATSTASRRGKVHRLEWYRPDIGQHHRSGNVSSDASSPNPTAETLDWPVGVWRDTMSTLQQVLCFVQSNMLLGRTKATSIVGNILFGTPNALPSHLRLYALGLESTVLGDDTGLLLQDLLRLLGDTCLPDYLPSSQLQIVLERRQNDLCDAFQPFCQAMEDCGFVVRSSSPTESSPTGGNKLMDFVERLPEKYVEHRRCVLLNQARDILRNHDYHNTTVVGVSDADDVVDATTAGPPEDPAMFIFRIQRSSVSEVASKLISLIRATMVESTGSPAFPDGPLTTSMKSVSSLTTLRPALYKAAREMLTLFRAIIPSLHGTEIASVPRTAAVFYNDCIFLAHHCLTLGVEFKQHYSEEDARGKLLKQSCIFVDNVPLFRELADQSLGDMLDVQANTLMEIVGERIGYLGAALHSHESLLEWSEAETALAAGVYHLRHLAQSWRPILSRRIFSQSMGHLADVILHLFWKQVVVVPTINRLITPNARHFLLGLFRQASQDLKELFVNPKPERCLEDCTIEWGRFEALVQFLDMPHLAQVESALATGVFRHVAAPELSKMIQMTFGDSAERQTLLHSLSRA